MAEGCKHEWLDSTGRCTKCGLTETARALDGLSEADRKLFVRVMGGSLLEEDDEHAEGGR